MPLHFGKPEKKAASILIFGQSGVGKTALVSTAPKPSFFSFEENGEDTLEALLSIGLPAFDLKRLVRIDSTADMAEAFTRLEKAQDIISVVFDSLTFFQQEKVVELMDDPTRPSKYRRDEMKWEDWGHLWVTMVLFMKTAPKLGYHLICTAQAEERESSELKGTTQYRPLLQGKFSQLVSAYFSVVGFYHLVKTAKGEIRRLELRPSIRWPNVKVRRPDLLPEYLDEPTIPQILGYLEFTKEKEKETVTNV